MGCHRCERFDDIGRTFCVAVCPLSASTAEHQHSLEVCDESCYHGVAAVKDTRSRCCASHITTSEETFVWQLAHSEHPSRNTVYESKSYCHRSFSIFSSFKDTRSC